MVDRDKVIKGLECHAGLCSESCPYFNITDYCFEELCRDVLELLKEQEPKRGKWAKQLSSCPSAISVGGSRTSACTICGGWGRKTFKYCPHCGAKMENKR